MGRYRIKISPDMDESLILKSWEEVYQFFKKSKRRNLEIGSGHGEFLIYEALKKPNEIFLGLDFQPLRVKKATEYVWKFELSNIRFMRYLVDEDICEKMFGFRFMGIYINHPDPWEKRKQRKRRIIRSSMLPVYHSLLEDEGVLWVSTDHQEYQSQIKKILNESGLFELEGKDYLSEQESKKLDRLRTRFEYKLENKGFPSKLFKAKKIIQE